MQGTPRTGRGRRRTHPVTPKGTQRRTKRRTRGHPIRCPPPPPRAWTLLIRTLLLAAQCGALAVLRWTTSWRRAAGRQHTAPPAQTLRCNFAQCVELHADPILPRHRGDIASATSPACRATGQRASRAKVPFAIRHVGRVRVAVRKHGHSTETVRILKVRGILIFVLGVLN